jgi:hypothetical protein
MSNATVDCSTQIQFIDCPSVRIQYDQTGKATVSYVVYTSTSNLNVAALRPVYYGGVTFNGSIMSIVPSAIPGGCWFQWQIQIQGIGYK